METKTIRKERGALTMVYLEAALKQKAQERAAQEGMSFSALVEQKPGAAS